jgi:hypothetical protein
MRDVARRPAMRFLVLCGSLALLVALFASDAVRDDENTERRVDGNLTGFVEDGAALEHVQLQVVADSPGGLPALDVATSDHYLGTLVGTDYAVRHLVGTDASLGGDAWCVFLEYPGDDRPGRFGGFCQAGRPVPGDVTIIEGTPDAGGPVVVAVAPEGADLASLEVAGTATPVPVVDGLAVSRAAHGEVSVSFQ